MQPINPKEMFKLPSTVEFSIVDVPNDTKSTTINKERSWNIKHPDTKKIFNVTIKNAGKLLNDKNDT